MSAETHDNQTHDEDMLKRTIASYDAHAHAYVVRNKQAGWWIGNPMNFKRLLPHLNDNATLLDVGCGAGQDVVNWQRHDVQAWGIDLSQGMLMQGKAHADGFLAQADMRRIPFASGIIDAVWMRASLLHIPRPYVPHVLNEVWRILRSGGHICLSVKEGVGESTTHSIGERHFVYYQANDLHHRIQRAGFRIIDTWYQSPQAKSNAWLGVVARKHA